MVKEIIILASVLMFSFGCSNSKKAQQKKNEIKVFPVVLSNDFVTYSRNNTETKILNAFISDSTLTLNISYNGGCETHGFELIGSKMIQKSYPPIRSVMLVHHSNNDDCRELVEQELKFNVSKFKYSNSSILLKLTGWKPMVELK